MNNIHLVHLGPVLFCALRIWDRFCFDPSNKSDISSYSVPNTVTSIRPRAFYECKFLNNVQLPNTITSIGSSVFRSCEGLESINIPSSVTDIGENAFLLCSSLKNIKIPDSVQNFGNKCIDDSTVIYTKSNSKALEYAKQNKIKYVIDDTSPVATVSIMESSNKSAIVKINSNEELQQVNGWALSSDQLTLAKTYIENITENITENIIVKDLVGNITTVKVQITNIDITELGSKPTPTPTFGLKQCQIKDNYIVKIKPKTKYRDFIKDIETNKRYTIKEKDTEISGEDLIKTGQTLITEDGHTYTLVVIGDLSGDGKIGLVELARISKIGAGKETDIKEIEKKAIDVNADGKINIIDLAAISKYATE